MGKIISINTSTQKGTIKSEVKRANLIFNFGIENDAHGGSWHRQISLLSYESFNAFKDKINIPLEHGVFGENFLVEGIDFKNIKIGDQLIINETILLEITQIGKLCHKGCEIRNIVGDCIMPREGVFAKVLQGGKVKKGDTICLK
ncbi:MAG: MOSC domain-containing protein [Tissierellia bacterium]|nr:MOSC domain-containing protein [Tissierellia bacterium]